MERHRHSGRASDEVVSLRVLGALHGEIGETATEETYLRSSVDLARSEPSVGADALASSLASIASFWELHGRPADALTARREERAVLASAYGPESPEAALAAACAIDLLIDAGEPEEARAEAQWALSTLDANPGAGPDLASDILFAVGHGFLALGELDAARSTFDRLASLAKDTRSASAAIDSLRALAIVAIRSSDFGSASPVLDELLALSRRTWGEPSTHVADVQELRASSASLQGDYAAAADEWADVVLARARLLGESNDTTIDARGSLAFCLSQSGKPAEAARALEPALAELLPKRDAATRAAQLLRTRGIAREQLGDFVGALADAEQVLALRRTSAASDEEIAWSLDAVARLHEDTGDLPGALPLREGALAAWSSVRGPMSPEAGNARARLGRARALSGDYAAALVDLRAAEAVLAGALGSDDAALVPVLVEISDALGRSGLVEEALTTRERVVALFTSSDGAVSPAAVSAASELVLLALRVGRVDFARERAVRLVQIVGDGGAPPERALALLLLGRAETETGNLDAAEVALRASVYTAEEHGLDVLPLGLVEWARLARIAGDTPTMERNLREALAAVPVVGAGGEANVALLVRASDAMARDDWETCLWLQELQVEVDRAAGDERARTEDTRVLVEVSLVLAGKLWETDNNRGVQLLLRASELDDQSGGAHAVDVESRLGFAFLQVGDSARSAEAYRAAVAIVEARDGPGSRALIPPLRGLTTAQHELGELSERAETQGRIAAITKQVFGPESSEYLDEVVHWALSLVSAERYREGAAGYELALRIQGIAHPADFRERVEILRSYGLASGWSADWKTAVAADRGALDLVRTHPGSFNLEDSLRLLDDLEFALAMAGDDEGSLAEQAEALRVTEAARGAADQRTIARVTNLATRLLLAAHPREALELLDRQLAKAGTGSSGAVELLVARTGALMSSGRLREARASLDTAGEYADRLNDDGVRAHVLIAEARWELELGAPATARETVERARASLGSQVDREDAEFQLLPLEIQAALDQGDLDSAARSIDSLTKILVGAGAPGAERSEDQTRYLLTRYQARYLEQLGDAHGAAQRWKEVVDLCGRVQSPWSRPCVLEKQRLAQSLFRAGELSRAKELMTTTVVEAGQQGGIDDALFVSLRMDEAWYAWASGEPEAARALLMEAAAEAASRRKELMVAATDDDRLLAAAAFRPVTDQILSLFDAPGDESTAYAAVLSTKGLTAAATMTLEGAWRDSKDPHVAELARQLAESADRPDPANAGYLRRLQRTLIRASARMGPAEFQPPNVSAICSALPKGAAFVDYVRYHRSIPGAEPHLRYSAFVLAQDDCRLHRVDLGPAAAIERSVHDLRSALAAGRAGESAVNENGRRVASQVWDPLAPFLGDGAVVLAPDGELGVLPFAGLPTVGGRFLVQERDLSVVESAYDLLRPASPPLTADAAVLLVGGVTYGPVVDDRETHGCLPSRAFPYLEGAEREATGVASLLGQAGFENVRVLGGADATEEGVRSAMPGSRVVHLATHGFASECRASADSNSATQRRPVSGLALANANLGGLRERDGLLLSDEVAGLDLRDVRVAVLSACETGLGGIQDGEGVIGLRRAFAVAGADSLIVSLWSVEDEPTRELMTAFYEELVGNGAPPARALQEAQRTLIRLNGEKYGSARAYTWAAFEALGGVR